MMDPAVEFNTISPSERDHRWHRIRTMMTQRGIDWLLVSGNSGRWNEMNANVRYLCGYADPLSGICYALFPLAGEGTLITQMPAKRSLKAVTWFQDIRARSTADADKIIVERLRAEGFEKGTIGLAGPTFGARESIGLPWQLYQAMASALPNVKMIDASDLFFELRSIKSAKEIRCMERSAEIADVGLEAHITGFRHGMTERAYYAAITHAVDCAGAEPPTFLLLESGPLGGKWPTQDPLPSNRILAKGDYVVSEVSPKFAGYQAQSLQCVVIGRAPDEMLELAKYGVEIWDKVAENLLPGRILADVLKTADPIMARAQQKFGAKAAALTPHLSYAGLGGPDTSARPAEIRPHQAFMGEIGPQGGHGKPAPPWRINGGYCLITTDGAPRHLHGKYPIDKRLVIEID